MCRVCLYIYSKGRGLSTQSSRSYTCVVYSLKQFTLYPCNMLLIRMYSNLSCIEESDDEVLSFTEDSDETLDFTENVDTLDADVEVSDDADVTEDTEA